MLLELEIENFALIDELRLTFDPGMTVLTGETGAGKSIILDSLSFLFGGSPRDKVPPAGGRRRVTAQFHAAEFRTLLEEFGVPFDEDELVASRELRPSGRSSCRLNGQLVTLAQLRQLGAMLVDIHGQHQSYSLKQPGQHLALLDRWVGAPHLDNLARYQSLFEELSARRAELDSLRRSERERLREIDWIERELEEIQEVGPRPGELEELELELKELEGAEELHRATREAAQVISGEGGVLDLMARASRGLETGTRADVFNSFLGSLREAEASLSDLGYELSSYADQKEVEPSRLDALQQRLVSLKGLTRKYGADMKEVLAYADEAGSRLESLRGAESRESQLRETIGNLSGRLLKLGRKLSKERKDAAQEIESQVVVELEGLNMPDTAFRVEFEELDHPGPEGLEKAEFLFSPNPGQPLLPLAKTASGGELSRVMLGLICLFAGQLAPPTLVFDEIDVGLGGRAAEAVAKKLRRLAQRVQLLCVTHLAVVAAQAQQHVRVSKCVTGGRTRVEVTPLESSERSQEVARMLSGDASQEQARLLAEELLTGAGG